MTSPQRLARTAGVYYLVVAVFGAFAHIVRGNVYVPGDAATTAQNVVADASLVRLSFMADLLQATFLLFVVMALYRLLQHVNKSVARAMVIFVVVAVAITCLNMVHQLGALVVATTPSYAAVFGLDGSATLVLLLLDLQHSGYLVAQIFFGLWLFPIGAVSLPVGHVSPTPRHHPDARTLAYLVDVMLQFLAPQLGAATNPALVVLVILSEVSMLAYLLIKGARAASPADRVLVAA
jgi:hypothetical protein